MKPLGWLRIACVMLCPLAALLTPCLVQASAPVPGSAAASATASASAASTPPLSAASARPSSSAAAPTYLPGRVRCPAESHAEGNACVADEVECPEGSEPDDEGVCVGKPVCPKGATFVVGIGCQGAATTEKERVASERLELRLAAGYSPNFLVETAHAGNGLYAGAYVSPAVLFGYRGLFVQGEFTFQMASDQPASVALGGVNAMGGVLGLQCVCNSSGHIWRVGFAGGSVLSQNGGATWGMVLNGQWHVVAGLSLGYEFRLIGRYIAFTLPKSTIREDTFSAGLLFSIVGSYGFAI